MWFWTKDPTTNFPYEIGEIIFTGAEEKSYWVLHKGKRKSNGESVSVFRFESKPGKEDVIERPKCAVKRCKTLRHPNVLTFIDSLETDKAVCMVTESIIPVDKYLESISHYTLEQRRLAISWGLYQVSQGLAFLINDCHLNHNNICHSSIFVNNFGNWKIGGFEFVTSSDSLYPSKRIAYLDRYSPPEMRSDNSSRPASKWSNDSYGLACLIWECFNGPLPSCESMRSPGKIPKQLIPLFNELSAFNPSKRLSPSEFISKARTAGGFMKNSFIDAMLFLEELQIKEVNEKNRFFNNLDTQIDSFPSDTCKNKILPLLISAFEFGAASGPGSSAPVLGPLFKIAATLDDDEYERKVVPCIVKLFSSKDRATRAKLLAQSEKYVKHLTKSVINDQVYPQVALGFADSNEAIREHTIKAMVDFAPKLNQVNMEDLISNFHKMQMSDKEPVIRTNLVVCLGKVAAYIGPSIRQSTLITCFLRAMRDPFPPARINGILAFSATQSFLSLKETATKVMPALCHLTLDPEKAVRDQTFKTLKGFVGKMEKVSEDPSLAEKMEADLSKSGSEATGSGNLTAGWASWAVTSLTSKFYRSKSTSSSLSTPPAPGNSSNTGPANSSNVKSEQSSSRPPSKQASEDSDVWGRGESADDDEVKSQASRGDWDSSGWDNDDDILNVQHNISASNCDKDIKPSKSPDGDEGAGGGGGGGRRSTRERTNSTNGWDDKEQDLLGSFGISEADLKPSNAPSSSASNASHTSSVPGGVASRSKGGSSGPRKTPGATKGPLKLGAKKLT